MRRRGAASRVNFEGLFKEHTGAEEEKKEAKSRERKEAPFPLNLPFSLLADDALAIAGLCCVVFAAVWAGSGFSGGRAAAGTVGLWLFWRVLPPWRQSQNLRIVCISDTHGRHRDLELPKGDILIHAGDFTHFGKIEDAVDFNKWLGDLPFKHKIVVNGNHDNNTPWQPRVEELLHNATFLRDSGMEVGGLNIYGTEFCWPMREESAQYALIPKDTDVVIAHGPAKGLVDGGIGCRALLWAMGRVRPRLVVSGHIHQAHGQCNGCGSLRGTTFVNAANCRDGYSIGWGPVVVDI